MKYLILLLMLASTTITFGGPIKESREDVDIDFITNRGGTPTVAASVDGASGVLDILNGTIIKNAIVSSVTVPSGSTGIHGDLEVGSGLVYTVTGKLIILGEGSGDGEIDGTGTIIGL